MYSDGLDVRTAAETGEPAGDGCLPDRGGVNLRGGSSVGRADVAHAMLAMIDDPAVVKQAVGVSY